MTSSLKIIADRNIPGLKPLESAGFELTQVDGRRLENAQLKDADALLVRSVSRVDQHLLEKTPIRFVGSATIGFDHLDTNWLDTAGITWCSAPGSNADSAAQYALSMLGLASRRLRLNLGEAPVGIIGLGNVGGRLKALLEILGIEVMACDPPLEAKGHPGLVPLRDVLQLPTISLHVPLSVGGNWPTRGLLGPGELASLTDGALLINTSRGEVIDEQALLHELSDNRIAAALDVWAGEPDIDPGLLKLSTVATPHVAGYAIEGKLRGARQITCALCEHFGKPFPEPVVPSPKTVEVQEFNEAMSIVLRISGVERDDKNLRELVQLPRSARPRAFDQLRRSYPRRHEFAGTKLAGASGLLSPVLKGLGFDV